MSLPFNGRSKIAAATTAALLATLTACSTPPTDAPIHPDRATSLQRQLDEANLVIADLRRENNTLRDQLAASSPTAEPSATATPDTDAELAVQRQRAADLQAENARLAELAGLRDKDALTDQAAARFTADYDPDADTTTVTSPTAALEAPRGLLGSADFTLGAAYTRPGTPDGTLSEPIDPLTLVFRTHSHPTNRLRTTRTATLTVDGQPYELPLIAYTELSENKPPARFTSPGKPTRSSSTYDEELNFTLTREALRALAHATDATLELPNFKATLTRQHTALFNAVLLRSQP